MILALLNMGLTLSDAAIMPAGVFYDIIDLRNPTSDEDD